jgi:heme/copper-type cytochrome/quinol oxidase subunit 4
MSVLRERVTKVWLLLMALTVVTTWGLSNDALSPGVAVGGIFLIAAVKVRFVMLDFMELRYAPSPVRAVFEGWIVVVVALIGGFWFLTPAAG